MKILKVILGLCGLVQSSAGIHTVIIPLGSDNHVQNLKEGSGIDIIDFFLAGEV